MSRIRYVLQNDSVVGKNTSVPRMVFISWRFRGRCQHWNLSPFMAAVGKLISCGWNRSCCLFWSDPWMKNGSYILTSFPCFKESIIFSDMPLCWLAAVLMLRSLGRLDSRHGSFPQAQRPAKLKIFTLWLCELADAWCIRLAQRTVGFDILSRREQGGGAGMSSGSLAGTWDGMEKPSQVRNQRSARDRGGVGSPSASRERCGLRGVFGD